MAGLNGSFADLIKDIACLLATGYNYDVIVRCGRAPGKIADFEAHSAILGVRSSYFRTAFSLNYASKKNGVFFLRKENIEPNIFAALMKYLYTSMVKLDVFSLPELIKFLVACDELDLSSVIDQIQSYAIENHSKWLQQNPLDYLVKLERCTKCTTLKTYLINQLDQTLFSSSDFILLSKETLKELLQKQHEGIGEIEIWNRLLEWSVNQANSFSFDPSLLSSLSPDACSLYSLYYDSRKRRELTLDEFERWSEQDCELVKHHISGIISFIRWQEISFKDFETRISPYKKLIPSSLYAELLSVYIPPSSPESESPSDSAFQTSEQHPFITTLSSNLIVPPNFPIRQYFDTTLLTVSHFNTISAWIARKDSDYYTKRLLPYKFNLLYRASKDGFDPKMFHERCDNRGPTVMVTKLYLGGKIIGGYNPLDWKPREQQVVENDVGPETSEFEIATNITSPITTSKRYSWMATYDSFLFSFQHLMPNTGIISRVTKPLYHKAVCYDPQSGPGFGAGLDIVVSNRYKTISTWGYSTYPEAQWFLSEQHMEVEDYEVFSVERDESVELYDEKENEECETSLKMEEIFGLCGVTRKEEGFGLCGVKQVTSVEKIEVKQESQDEDGKMGGEIMDEKDADGDLRKEVDENVKGTEEERKELDDNAREKEEGRKEVDEYVREKEEGRKEVDEYVKEKEQGRKEVDK
ncbi:5045_t:CDS:2 [Acaulospora colombiana]|uniref:5045_t:CDS:1 n=1 Tax=Acaulospora colombiana TaxID=27376 RepID=A0ACA9K681_9GLOM|nr:5045_t:CDS:2 [Acaulospora colombiana]